MTPTRQCERCGLTLVRRHPPSGLPETLFKFARRRFCSSLCANQRQPKPPAPPTLSFAAAYRDAIVRGFDPFELNDAHWEA